ncbi:MAG: SpoIIIAH-like family protein [Oscillospiraceae bacterium]|jgi:stage III sporulation protein AH|nr:SpoIIIAH-like family protein [Oscillospiraceae bacterium]
MKPIKIQRRQVVLASLAIALGTAVFLNWQFSPKKDFINFGDQTKPASKTFGEARYVNGHVNGQDIEKGPVSEKAVIKNFYEDSRSKREEVHKNTMDDLKKIIMDPNISDKVKENVSKKILNLAENKRQEVDIEVMILAKMGQKNETENFIENCIAMIQENKCSVIVDKNNLERRDIDVICSVVTELSGIEKENVRLVTR